MTLNASLFLRQTVSNVHWGYLLWTINWCSRELARYCKLTLIVKWEQDFLRNSYGYRPNKSAHQAVQSLHLNLQFKGYGYIVEADIKGFFNNMDHQWLMQMLALRIDDKALLNLINQWLKARIKTPDGKFEKPISGTPQGGVISPVLANIYLHYALDL